MNDASSNTADFGPLYNDLMMMSTGCRFLVMISEKSRAILVPQEIPPIGNEGCVVSAAGCRWGLGRVPLPTRGRRHPISTLFFYSDCTHLAKKHLFDLRYLLLCRRTFPLIDAAVPLVQSVVTQTEQAIHHILFQAGPTMSALSGNTCLVTLHILGDSPGADRDNAACLYKTI